MKNTNANENMKKREEELERLIMDLQVVEHEKAKLEKKINQLRDHIKRPPDFEFDDGAGNTLQGIVENSGLAIETDKWEAYESIDIYFDGNKIELCGRNFLYSKLLGHIKKSDLVNLLKKVDFSPFFKA